MFVAAADHSMLPVAVPSRAPQTRTHEPIVEDRTHDSVDL